jgi:hypothetical protein
MMDIIGLFFTLTMIAIVAVAYFALDARGRVINIERTLRSHNVEGYRQVTKFER